jgi:hypothetical protein
MLAKHSKIIHTILIIICLKSISDRFIPKTFAVIYKALYTHILNNKLMAAEITWDFFHPYFYLLLNKYKTCKLGKITFNESLGKLSANFELFGKNLTQADIKLQVFTFIDEMCGLFVYKLDPQVYFTTSVNLEIIKPIYGNSYNIQLNLVLDEERKKIIQIKLYEDKNLKIEGIAIFKKPKTNIPMAKF